jgi:hypothetical protein
MQDFYIINRVQNGIFVYFNITDEPTDKGPFYFLYNILKSIHIISSEDDNLFIYEHKTSENNEVWNLIAIQSKEKEELEQFDKDNLENVFIESIANINKDDDSLVIQYNDNNYTSHFKKINFENIKNISLESIEHIII